MHKSAPKAWKNFLSFKQKNVGKNQKIDTEQARYRFPKSNARFSPKPLLGYPTPDIENEAF